MTATPEDKNSRSFSTWLTTVERGRLHADLSEHLEDIVAGLNDHRAEYGGKPQATMTITLSFKLDGPLIEVNPALKVKMPEGMRDKSIYFVTPENGLSRQDPNQREMFADVNARRQRVETSA